MITECHYDTHNMQDVISRGVEMMLRHGTKNFKYSSGVHGNGYGSTFITNNKAEERHHASRHGAVQIIFNTEVFSHMAKNYPEGLVSHALAKVIIQVMRSHNFDPINQIVSEMWVAIDNTDVTVYFKYDDWSKPTDREFLQSARMRQ